VGECLLVPPSLPLATFAQLYLDFTSLDTLLPRQVPVQDGLAREGAWRPGGRGEGHLGRGLREVLKGKHF
jgi:hypothetical protein